MKTRKYSKGKARDLLSTYVVLHQKFLQSVWNFLKFTCQEQDAASSPGHQTPKN